MSNDTAPETLEWEPYPFLYRVCDTVDESCTVELDYLPDGVDSDMADKVLVAAHCALSTNSVEKAIEMVRADERARLWEQAMKPEVRAAMAKALWVADDKPDVGHGSDGYRMEAEYHIRLVLNLILGPNPNEQENQS